MTLPSPEEVAKEFYKKNFYYDGENGFVEKFSEFITLDRSRLIQHIREKMPSKPKKAKNFNDDEWVRGFNDALEAVEKILEEVK